MALTAAIRNMVFALLTMLAATPAAQGVIAFLANVGIVINEAWLGVAAGTISVFIAGAITYALNKLGSRYSWINLILSFGRAKTGAVYVPADKESAEITTTPPGEKTIVVATNETGKTTPVVV